MTQEQKARAYDEALEKARKRVMTEPQDHTDAILKDIFPQLRENNDEKIRKWIFDLVNNMSFENLTAAQSAKNEEWRKKVLAYLEKQKDPFESGRGLYYYDGEKTTYMGYPATEENPYDFAMSQQEKQKEQKPTDNKAFEEWIDDWWKHNKVNNPNSYNKGDEIQFDEKGFKNFCRGIRNMYQQKPAEWSEEDKMNLNGCICSLHQYGYMTYADFLKSLPERFNLQSKQEWSDEDEDFINMLILHFNYLIDKGGDSVETYKSYIKKLKSLRPSWKPSEEQMNGLAHAINLDVYDAKRYGLDSLYNDLKKLM